MDQRKMLNRKARGKAFGAILTLICLFVAEVIGLLVVIALGVPDTSLWQTIVPEGLGALVAIGSVVLLGAGKWAVPSRDDTKFSLRFGWWCLAVSAVLMVFEIITYVSEGTPVSADWPQRLFECIILCLIIGVFEEFVFRGLILQGLLAILGKRKNGLWWSVAITSVVFGLAHVTVEDFSGTLQIIQALLKAVQTGIYSLLMCAIVLRTRKLCGASLFHGLDDFLLVAPGIVLFNESLDVEYVSEGADAVPSIVLYLIVIALYLPLAIKAVREMRRMQPGDRGAFMEAAMEAAGVSDAGMAGVGTPAVMAQGDAGMVRPPVPVTQTVPDAQPVPGAETMAGQTYQVEPRQSVVPTQVAVAQQPAVPAEGYVTQPPTAPAPVPTPTPNPAPTVVAQSPVVPAQSGAAQMPVRDGRPPRPKGL